MKRLLLIGSLLLSATLLAACAPPGPSAQAPRSQSPAAPTSAPQDAAQVGKPMTVAGGSYTNVTSAELKTMLDKKDFPLVNVHIPFEGNIANTDVSIPYNEIDRNLDKLPADKNAKIVLYCRTGRMSAEAAQTLVKLGYANVWNLDGGMVAWKQAGYTIEPR